MTYLEYKAAFIKRHSKSDWTTETSPMDNNGKYVKYYNFSDGSQLIEVNQPVFRMVEADAIVEGIKVKIQQTVKLFETEAWNTDNSESVKFYELW